MTNRDKLKISLSAFAGVCFLASAALGGNWFLGIGGAASLATAVILYRDARAA